MRAPRTVRLFALAAALTVVGWACSSGGKRDQFYGTDVGVGWVPGDGSALLPDTAPAAHLDAGADASVGDAAEAGADASDGSAAVDAAMSDTGG